MPDPSPDDLVLNPRPWFTWIVGAFFALGVLVWFAGGPVMEMARERLALHFISEAEGHLERADYAACANAIRSARRWSLKNERVLRVSIEFLDKAGGEDNAKLHMLRELIETGHATLAERARVGRLLLARGEVRGAREELAAFSEDEQKMPPVLELRAALRRAEGFPAEADRLLLQALELDHGEPESRLRLALLEMRAPYPETRRSARARLFEIATGEDDHALQAIERLSRESELTGNEARELQRLLAQHPAQTPQKRLDTLAAMMRARPQDREAILDAESASGQGMDEERLAILTNWLNAQGAADRALALLPEAQAEKSSKLFNVRIAALARLERWEEVERLLKRPGTIPMSRTGIQLWLARAANRHRDGIPQVRQALQAALMASGEGSDAQSAQLTLAVAEELAQWDLAIRACEGIAKNHPRTRVTMLEKIFEISLRDKHTPGVVSASARLAELQPQNDQAVFRARWFSFVAGEGIEASMHSLLEESARYQQPGPRHLLLALAAWRMGDLERTREHLAQMPGAVDLSTGQRAVHAGLLSACGSVGPAFQLAERVPAALLLPEELRFLKRAL